MKNLINAIIAIFALNGCNSTETNTAIESTDSIVDSIYTGPSASIEFTEPTSSNSTFLFSTVGGKMLIMADASTAQKMNELTLKESTPFSFYKLGVGNAFLVDSNGKFLLYTARHCAIGAEKITRNIGSDIAVVNYTDLKNISPGVLSVNEGYKIDTAVNDNDSVFIKGYLSDKTGKVYSVLISGVGKKDNLDNHKNDVLVNGEYLQQNTLSIPLEKNVELGGLSGAPAFNKKGKAIGMYSGRNFVRELNRWYLRVSLFN